MPGAPWGWLDLWEEWADVVAGLSPAGIQVHMEIPLMDLGALGGCACTLACLRMPSSCPQDELCILSRAELLEENESLSIPCLERAQLGNLVLSLRWGIVQRKPSVGLAEPGGTEGSRREQM